MGFAFKQGNSSMTKFGSGKYDCHLVRYNNRDRPDGHDKWFDESEDLNFGRGGTIIIVSQGDLGYE